MAQNQWITLPMSLTGPLDTRSRPADLAPGALRYKLSMAINRSGKLCRRAGFGALDFGQRSDFDSVLHPVNNWDFHRRGHARDWFNYLGEIADPDGQRFLFAGTQSTFSVMDSDTSEWTDIATGLGATGSRWKAASLRKLASATSNVYFTNNVDPPRVHTLGSGVSSVLPFTGLPGPPTKAKIVLQSANVVIWMNVEQVGKRYANKIIWSDFRDGENYAYGVGGSVAGEKFLDDGEEILNALEAFGAIWIFTNQRIWRMFVFSDDVNTVFSFQRWYSDPVNRSACLAYENAIAFTGKEFFWLGQKTIFWMNKFSSEPSSPDWLLKASGLMFEGAERIDPAFCSSPIARFVPDNAGNAREVWFSFPKLGSVDGLNNSSLVLSFNTDSVNSSYQTADYVDVGFTAFCSFSHTTDTTGTCALEPTFIGASGVDYCLKQIGTVFQREFVNLIDADVTKDIPDVSYGVTAVGYYSQMLGLIPVGLSHREKIIRSLTVVHDTVDPIEIPNRLNLRIGGSYILADPLSTQPHCGVLWHMIDSLPLECPDVDSLTKLAANNLRQDDATEFQFHEQARLNYFDLKIVSPTGGLPIGSDSAFNELRWESLTLP